MKITKHKFKAGDEIQKLDLPEDAVVLKVAVVAGDVTIWVEAEADELALRHFLVIPTGAEFELPDDAEYVDTLPDLELTVYEVP